ncbi:hypothetical protein DH86_00003839, partial [Scytalidium sp. 3C]
MFRNRSSQKPGDDFIANFRQSFPEITTNAAVGANGQPITVGAPGAPGQNVVRQEDIKDFDPTPRAQHEPWRFTPSLLDPNSFAFNNFANQPLGFYTPTPGGTNAIYHSQAGDLHTPGMGIGVLGTPLSLSASADGLQTGAMMD